jgi:ribosomal protein S18 acetylase RimI-like enzyme
MIRLIEELSINALPAFETMLNEGWILRFADGYTKRANSVNPLYNTNTDLGERISNCNLFYKERGLLPVYKLTPAAVPSWLDGLLETQGYEKHDVTSIQVLELKRLRRRTNQIEMSVAGSLTDEWLDACCRLNEINAVDRLIFARMLAKILPQRFFITLSDRGQVVACGFAVLERGFLGLFSIAVDPARRREGYGENLLLKLLHLGHQNGAKHAYLQVRSGNQPALKLYEKLGFEEKYSYWYRIPDIK